eukprot:3933482-Rhodomonas_salina.2
MCPFAPYAASVPRIYAQYASAVPRIYAHALMRYAHMPRQYRAYTRIRAHAASVPRIYAHTQIRYVRSAPLCAQGSGFRVQEDRGLGLRF